MALPAEKLLLAAEEYLEIERNAFEKSEFYDGEMFAMAGASRSHNLIVANLLAAIHAQLKGSPCRVYPSDMRVRVEKSQHYTYPDLSALCGREEFEDDELDVLLNPQVIIEVLSPSTEDYDRGRKFTQYRKLSSLREYILVDQRAPLVERHVRQSSDRWLLEEISGASARLEIETLGCTLGFEDIYLNVDFPETLSNSKNEFTPEI